MRECEDIQDEDDTIDLVVWEEYVEWVGCLSPRSKIDAVGIVSDDSP